MMKERKPLTNIALTRHNLRISFACLVFAVLTIVNSSEYWSTFYQMGHITQIIGFVVSIVLLVAAGIYSLAFLVYGIIAIVNKSDKITLFPHMLGIFLEFLFLMLNIPALSVMRSFVSYGGADSSRGLGMAITLTVFAVINLIFDVVVLIQAKTNGLTDGGKFTPYGLSAAIASQPKQQDVPIAQAPVNQVPANTGRVAFCPNCGSPITEGSSFCSNCGHELPKEDKE